MSLWAESSAARFWQSILNGLNYPVFARLLLLFILLPLADLVLIVMLLRIHWMLTLLWILVSGLAGAWYVRRQGTAVMQQMRHSLGENRIPTDMLVEGCLVLVAGALLITPGLLTDVIGFSILVPPGRRWYRRRFVDWMKTRVTIQTFQGGFYQASDVVDATVVGPSKAEPAEPAEPADPLPRLKQAEFDP